MGSSITKPTIKTTKDLQIEMNTFLINLIEQYHKQNKTIMVDYLRKVLNDFNDTASTLLISSPNDSSVNLVSESTNAVIPISNL